MAKRRTTRSSPSRSRSSSNSSGSFSSILTGLIIGLTIAAIAAFMLTRTPVPLRDNTGSTSSSGLKMPGTSSPTVGSMSAGKQPLIDPNAWLSNDGRITSQQNAATGTSNPPPIRPLTPAEPAKTPQSGQSQDQIASLIKQLPAASTPARASADTKTATPASPAPATEQKLALTAKGKDIPLNTNTAKPATTSGRYLQVGAFRNAKEADSIRARMILMGYNAEITKITVNNVEINRVRIGPFKNDDELNRSRTELSKAKISSTIVR